MIKTFKLYLNIFNLFILILISLSCKSQSTPSESQIERTLRILSADSMAGRRVFTEGNIKAAEFIKNEFTAIGLHDLEGIVDFEDTFSIKSKGTLPVQKAKNIVGIIPGKTKKDQYVIFSAHYDHIGILPAQQDDSIANGADDDASGTTAVIELARYFKKLDNNELTLVFVAFTAEEVGGYGSRNFAAHLSPEKVIAMINIEMIGKESKFGENAAFLTGYEKSNLGKIMEKNLAGNKFKVYPDPYPQENLFYRSDNATFAYLGVPAHTISTDQIDRDPFYHTVDDEFNTLNIKNMGSTISGIIEATSSIIAGKDVPQRIIKK